MELVPAQLEDLDPLLTIYDRARQRMHAQGNFQWADDYPGAQRLRADLARQTLYLLKIAGKTIGACALIPGPDESYQVIRDGQWLNPAPYWAIHRLVVDPWSKARATQGPYSKLLNKGPWPKAFTIAASIPTPPIPGCGVYLPKAATPIAASSWHWTA